MTPRARRMVMVIGIVLGILAAGLITTLIVTVGPAFMD
jgi:hypothetical protein